MKTFNMVAERATFQAELPLKGGVPKAGRPNGEWERWRVQMGHQARTGMGGLGVQMGPQARLSSGEKAGRRRE